jgi:CelD/BcsL family acetyltransferase involved in cellulose biosynthesis
MKPDAVSVSQLNPLTDPRWASFVARHPRSSMFHTRGWLEALQRTYGYRPIVFATSSPDGELSGAVVFCEIRSWLTGKRLVSLPFSDHCDPLVGDGGMEPIGSYLQERCADAGWQYVELRPSAMEFRDSCGYDLVERFVLHVVDLRPDLDAVFRRCHRSSTQRKVLRARREGLVCSEGRTPDVLGEFYRLLTLTRRRHGLPPQPYRWFENLAACVGDAMTVRLARYRGQPIAGMVTVRHGSTLTYKYGASDDRWHRLGPMHLLFWKAIEEAHAAGCAWFDLGRTDLDDHGLITFKDRWGATRMPLNYWRFSHEGRASSSARDWMTQYGVRTARRVPARVCALAGRVLYRHLG